MGQNATETLSEIEASRQRLQNDIDVLQQRLPDGEVLARRAKIIGGAAVVAGLGLVAAYVLTKHSLEKRRRYEDARFQAEVVADVLEERG